MNELLPLVLALRLWHLAIPAEPEVRPWRLVDESLLHVGVRASALVSTDEVAVAATLQVRCAWCGGLP